MSIPETEAVPQRTSFSRASHSMERTNIDLEALLEILVGKDAEVGFERGRRTYSVEMTTEE
jgi:hypothetical protein